VPVRALRCILAMAAYMEASMTSRLVFDWRLQLQDSDPELLRGYQRCMSRVFSQLTSMPAGTQIDTYCMLLLLLLLCGLQVGADEKLASVIDGESLVNDGSALVIFLVLQQIVQGASLTVGQVSRRSAGCLGT